MTDTAKASFPQLALAIPRTSGRDGEVDRTFLFAFLSSFLCRFLFDISICAVAEHFNSRVRP